MALNLSSIGAARPLGSAALPGALRAVHALGKGLNFASKLDQKLLDLTGENDLLAQIAGLLQNSTPMATIVDRIAKQLTDPATRRTLERALANALAPPGTSPPLSTGEQAAALEQRLKNLLSTLTGETETAGQQNEFSGNILDANPAKESPAQQKDPTPTDTSADEVNLFAQALLQKAALGNAVVHASTVPAITPQAPAAAPASNVPDILTRILARAANADAQRSGHVPQPTANTSTAAPSALFQRLIAIVAEHSGTQSDANADKQFAQNFAADQNASPVSNPHQQGGVQAAPAFTTQVASAPASAPAAPAQTAAPLHTPIDPQAVIEQLVKGITMRNSGTTSELRMRLQPEHLGDVALKLTVTGNTITANVIAQNAHVRDLLLANQQQLARSLSQAGLSLGNFSVDVSGGNGGFTQQQAHQQRASARPGAFDVSALLGEDAQWTDPRFGPPILPMGKSLVLNYLV